MQQFRCLAPGADSFRRLAPRATSARTIMASAGGLPGDGRLRHELDH
jgi:hypothetical protein